MQAIPTRGRKRNAITPLHRDHSQTCCSRSATCRSGWSQIRSCSPRGITRIAIISAGTLKAHLFSGHDR